MCDVSGGWSLGWINGKKAHWPVGSRTRTLCICTVTNPRVHTRQLSASLTAPGLLQAQAGVWAGVTKGRNFVPQYPKSSRQLLNLHAGLYPATWKSVMGSHGPDWWPAGQREGGSLYCLQMNRIFFSIAAKSALFISIQSAPEMP